MQRTVDFWLKQGLSGLDFVHAHYGARHFAPHWHDGFSIAAITRNAHAFRWGRRVWVAARGDLIVLNPGEPHDGHPTCTDGWSTRTVFVPPILFSRFAGIDVRARRFDGPVLHAPMLADLFVRWHRRSRSAVDLAGLAETRQLFSTLATFMEDAPARHDAPDIWQMLADVGGGTRDDVRHAHPPTVAALAAGLARSRTTVWRRTITQTGFAPKSLLNQLQLDAAKRSLAAGRSVVEAAVESGYHDQSHFTRRFTFAYGVTPALFRKARLGGIRSAAAADTTPSQPVGRLAAASRNFREPTRVPITRASDAAANDRR